ncbi:MFS transporter [Gemmatirosa kalamazoonensis]
MPTAARPRARLGRNVVALSAVSLFTDASSEMIYPLLPIFLQVVLGATASTVGAIEGAAESVAALLKLASGWWSDRVRRRKPLVVAGYTIASVARPLVAVAATPAHVLLVRLVDRVGKGIRTSPRDALLADSVDPAVRGRAFGFHRAADHAGAVVGPLVAFALLQVGHLSMRSVFWLAAVPAALAVLTLVLAVREAPGPSLPPAPGAPPREQHDDAPVPAPNRTDAHADAATHGRAFPTFLGAVTLFTLGNSSDAFLLLRARQLGVPVALVPVLWSAFHVVKSASSTPGGALSDRYGRKPLIVAGWLLYAAVYLAFGRVETAWAAWALFGVYGLFFGLTEGTEKALVADLVPRARRGTAFGWYNLAIGLAALPASLLFGFVWDRVGPPAAFTLGAFLALLAAIVLGFVRVDPR